MTLFLRLLRYAVVLALAGILLGGIALGTAYWLIAPRLPSVETLKDVRLQVPLRVWSADDKLIATFGETKRTPVRIGDVPTRLKQAFLAAGEWEERLPPWQEGLEGSEDALDRRRRRAMIGNARAASDRLAAALGKDAVHFAAYDGEDHASILTRAIPRVLRFIS